MMNTRQFANVVNSIKHWYIPALVGLVLILVGIYVFATPFSSYLVLATLFSISFFVSGLLQIGFSIVNRNYMHSWGWHLVSGILYTLLGAFLIVRPGISITTLPYVVGFYLLFHSAHTIGWSLDLKKMGFKGWGLVTSMGTLGIIFSFILLADPVFAGLSLIIWTGLTFMISGISGILFSFGLRKIKGLPGKISDNLNKRIEILKQNDDSDFKKAS